MADIIKEVDEADRQARLEELWAKYRVFVYGGIGLVIAAVAGWEGFKWNNDRVAQERMAIFEDALALQDAADYQGAADIFSTLVDAGTPLSPVAAHYLATLQKEQLSQPDAALKTLEAVTDTQSAFGQLALLKYGHATAQDSSLETLEATLAPLLEQKTAVAALAVELVGSKAFEERDFVRAKAYFDRLEGFETLPNGLNFRMSKAQAALKYLMPDESPTNATINQTPDASVTIDTVPVTGEVDENPTAPTQDGDIDNANE